MKKLNDMILNNTTCFSEHEKHNVSCNKNECRYWIKHCETKNCAIIASNGKKEMTLEQIGSIYSLTRMRICQIEKKLKDNLKSQVSLHSF